MEIFPFRMRIQKLQIFLPCLLSGFETVCTVTIRMRNGFIFLLNPLFNRLQTVYWT